LTSGLPTTPELVYEAHSTDYQTPLSLKRMVKDHFSILKVGPWVTFAYREAIFALDCIENEMPAHRQKKSHVREVLEAEMLRNPEHWIKYFRGDDDQRKFARAFSLSDRCRYYWPRPAVEQATLRLLNNLDGPLPMALLSQFLPAEYEAIREGRLMNSATTVIRYHIQRVLRVYAAGCGVLAS
jgi:D-tagatose-1,6-bisphosphate aldolase subunit GatZ/KbaZ